VSAAGTSSSTGVGSLLAIELVLLLLGLALAFTPADVLPDPAGHVLQRRRSMLVTAVCAIFMGFAIALLVS
jgi:hypothetical protein